ncbi:hypothetical protein FEM48_Zijuj04G0155400 [Ziziphus jujuba var. spinosa]|uniref:Tf2-1-like SH3-like domain-containing protein n=1 Tax=Ziziphus jujuba var. spinosa TaxID=714518 RepID=A0A978VKP3_ZIZJJ|nr:hypothetical protein FEM48_Zijuj04G0155400 [Ziziphus jujuba var. spinosa]
MAEFAYNSSINRSTGRSPFEIVTGMLPRKPIDLVPLPLAARPSAEAETFGRHIQEIHDDIRRKIALSNESYKAHADLKRKFAEFNEGDMVMVRIRPERFPRGTYKKLHSRNVGPYKILKKISSNAYVLDLPKDMGISNVFNIEDLSSYEGHENDTARGSKAASLPSTFRLKEEIEDVVDHQIGLANAMVKLWEKSAIAKIAIKRGVENTCNERMAEELRGNDFLPPAVMEALRERRKLRDLQQDEEEQARKLASASDSIAKGKVRKAEIALEKVQENLEPTDLPDDLETLTVEERFLFRKIGLSMKPYPLLDNRERKGLSASKACSNFFGSREWRSALDKTTKGYAIIVYRGKNYLSPLKIRPRNLLSIRQPLGRSIELQRREALQHHISDLEERIDSLKSELEDSRSRKMIDKEGNLHPIENDSSLVNDDVDGKEAYLEVYDSGNDDNSDGDV